MATRSIKKQKEPDEIVERALAAPVSAAELQTRITARAYEVFLARNGAPGDSLSDWLTAEHEVRGSLPAITPATEDVTPIPTAAPKRKRTPITAKPAVAGSSRKSSTKPSTKTKSSAKSSGPPPSSTLRARKRKTTDE